MAAMREQNKATGWKRDGRRGRRMSKRMANVLERRRTRELQEKARRAAEQKESE